MKSTGKARFVRISVIPIVVWDDGDTLTEVKVNPIVLEGGAEIDAALTEYSDWFGTQVFDLMDKIKDKMLSEG